MNTIYICPKCQKALSQNEKSFRCESGHSYDVARTGYVNLLLGAAAGTHGDNREMIEARRDFLACGYYAPLSDKLNEILVAHLPVSATLLDVGIGEGYYTDRAYYALMAAGKTPSIYGFDISKDAVKLAAARNKNISLSVASAYHMPYASCSFDAVMNLFSPLALEQTVRVLKSGGYFLMAIPEREHLFGLKAAIYDTPYKNEVADYALSGLDFVFSERIRYTVTLDKQEKISALFRMTPYAYRTSASGRSRVMALSKLTTELDFRLLLYRKA